MGQGTRQLSGEYEKTIEPNIPEYYWLIAYMLGIPVTLVT